MRSLVVLPAGLGDCLLLLPLVDALIKRGDQVTLIVESRIFPTSIVDSKAFRDVISVKSNWHWAKQIVSQFLRQDEVYLNHLCRGRRHTWFAKLIFPKRILTTPEQPPIQQDLLTNMQLAGTADFNPREFASSLPSYLKLPAPRYQGGIAVQMSGGSGTHVFKNWPTPYWHQALLELAQLYPHETFYLLGTTEEASNWRLLPALPSNVVDVMGQTSVSEAMSIVMNSKTFLGVDGGLLHAAALSGVPTLSLWGPSNAKLYGYATINPSQHEEVTMDFPCAPCNAWNKPNRTRVQSPFECPDYVCMTAITPALFLKQAGAFLGRQ